MERIELYKFDAAHISISIGLYFNKEGQLIFDGYDRGKRVEYALGDSDYEYQRQLIINKVNLLLTK